MTISGEKYCLRCGHRSNRTIRGIYLRCKKCGDCFPVWNREINTYIYRNINFSVKELIQQIKKVRAGEIVKY